MIKVFIADGQFLSRQGLRFMLEQEPGIEVIGEAVTRKDLQQQAFTHCDLLIIDPKSLPGMNLKNFIELPQLGLSMNVLVIANVLSAPEVKSIINQGITGFVTKDCSENEIVRSVYMSAGGEKFFCNKILELLLQHKNGPVQLDDCDPTVLTDRETEVVKLVAKGYTTLEIAGYLELSRHTVNTHRKNILKKLKLKTPAQLVNYAVRSTLVEEMN